MMLKSPLANQFMAVVQNGDAFGRKPLSSVTVRSYEHALKRVEALMSTPFEDWEYGDMESFFVKCEEAGYKGTTTKSMANVLRIMFRWAVEAGVYKKPNPMRGLPQVVREDAPPPVVSPTQARELLAALVEGLKDKREAASDLALRIPSMDDRFIDKYAFLFELSYFSGVPLKRLLHVKKSDLEGDGFWQTITYGSKKKREFISLPSDLLERLRTYVSEHPATDYVFYGESGPAHGGSFNQPMNSAQAYNVFKQARNAAGFDEELSATAWAESYAAWQAAHSS